MVRNARELIEVHHDPSLFSMVRIVLAPSGVVSDLPEVFEALAEQYEGVRLHTHLHHHEDTRFAQLRHGTSPWRILVDRGFASDRLWVAHGVTAPHDEIAEYAAAGFGVAHIPAADLKLG